MEITPGKDANELVSAAYRIKLKRQCHTPGSGPYAL